MGKDTILERLVISDGLAEAYVRPERERPEAAGDHWTGPVLLERVAYLRKLARFSQGASSETIREFAGYSIALMVLLRSGDCMVDEDHGRIFIVIDGSATLATGETAPAGTIGEGNVGGVAAGGNRELRRGDVVHIAAGIPHQLLLAGEKSFSCMVIQVAENVEPQPG